MKKRLRFRGVQQSRSRCSRGLCGRVREVKRKWTGKRRTKGYKSVSRQERINLTVWVVTRKEGSEARVGTEVLFRRGKGNGMILK